jgi:1-acyl-sn-glycerol-3-phosphate acyltransferase
VRPSAGYLAIGFLTYLPIWALFRLRARGLEHIPSESGAVLAANHNSNVDPWPLGLPLFPRRYLRFMAKSELYWFPLRYLLDAAGAFPVRRGEQDVEAIETAVELCRSGDIVVMFPEGTRRRKGLRKKWEPRAHTGAARIARDAGVPLVPAAIRGTERLRRLGPFRVLYGPPVDVSDDPRETTERLMTAIRELEAAL